MKELYGSAEESYGEELLRWMENMIRLREQHRDTPPGFRDDETVSKARKELAERRAAFLAHTSHHLIWPQPPSAEPEWVPREELQAKIRQLLEAGRSPVILHGMGGIGKSVLARAYAAGESASYEAVWIWNCEKGLGDAVFDDNLLAITNLRFRPENGDTRPRHIRRKLELFQEEIREQRVLLVLDNCDFLRDPLSPRVFALPADIIVTTRTNPAAWTGVLPERAASLPLPAEGFESEEEWHRFARSLGAGEDWMEKKEACFGNLLKTRIALLGEGKAVDKDGLLPRDLSAGERKLLSFLAMMPLDGFPADMLRQMLPPSADPWTRLKNRGLLEPSDNGKVRMHPLIREAAAKAFPPSASELSSYIRRLADLLYNAWERNYPENLKREPYARSVLQAFPSPPPFLAMELDIFITLLWVQCRYEEAQQYSLQLFDACRRRYGGKHERTGFCALRTGAVFRNAGQVEEAGRWFRLAYEILSSAQASSPRMLLHRIEAHSRMSLILTEAGAEEEAAKHDRIRIRLAERLREKYPDLLPGFRGDPALEYPYALLGMGERLLGQEDRAGAEAYLEKAVEALKTTNASPYREVEFHRLRIRLWLEEGRASEALPLAEECLERVMAYREPLSREILRAEELLAEVLHACGRGAEAARHLERVMEVLSAHYPGQEDWMRRIAEKWQQVSRESPKNG